MRNAFAFYAILSALFLIACASSTPSSTHTPAPPPLSTLATLLPISTASPRPTPPPTDTGWVALGAGVERRELSVYVPNTSLVETMILFRFDPQAVTFRVHYTPGRAQVVSSWAPELTANSPLPLLIVNAGFFTDDYHVAAFTVADGQAEGVTYQDFGGMFSVQSRKPRVRSLTVEPWRPDESFEQAVQGFPVLVRPGRAPFTTPDGQRSRRTAIGQTSTGQVVVVIAPHYTLTLVELSAALLDPKLDLAIAVNLDGGSSTGYWASRADNLDSDKPIPAVIAAYPR